MQTISRPHYRAGRCARARPETVVRPCTLQVRRPVDFGSEVSLKQNVESERCAIYRYQANCRIHQRN